VAESPSPRHTDVPSSAPSPTHHGWGQPALHPRVYDRVFPALSTATRVRQVPGLVFGGLRPHDATHAR
jgi:hypothetical protein